MKNTAVFAGSMDPVTTGHYDIVSRAAQVFQQVIVVIVGNAEKKYLFTPQVRLEAATAAFASLDNVKVMRCDGLLAEFVRAHDAVLVKGARTSCDFEYEKTLADINHAIAEVETFILPTRPELGFVSSTFVKELIRFGKPLDGFVPADAIPKLVRAV